MILTRLALTNTRVTWLLLGVIVIAGLQAFKNMPRAYDPGFIIRAAQVVTYFPGAAAERVEELVSAPIEEVVKEIPELDFVKSESRSGISIVQPARAQAAAAGRSGQGEVRSRRFDFRAAALLLRRSRRALAGPPRAHSRLLRAAQRHRGARGQRGFPWGPQDRAGERSL